MDYKLCILAILCCWIQPVYLDISSCSTSQYHHSRRCCNKCEPGSHVVAHCNETTQTVCGPCQDGTFSEDWTSLDHCKRCKNVRCPPTMSLVSICNKTTNNQCGCSKSHQYQHFSTGSCRDCKHCPPGQYPIAPCSSTTVCHICAEKHFSNKSKNYNAGCVKCRTCKTYKSHCSPAHDAVCAVNTTVVLPKQQKEALHMTVSNPVTSTISTTPVDAKSQSSVDWKLIVVVALMLSVFVIILLILWKTWKVPCRNKYSIKLNTNPPQTNSVSFGGLLFRNVSIEVRLTLDVLLNPPSPNNWKKLGAELGIPLMYLRNFEEHKGNETSEMLRYWETSNSATVDRLHVALRAIGRDDACALLEEEVRGGSCETDV